MPPAGFVAGSRRDRLTSAMADPPPHWPAGQGGVRRSPAGQDRRECSVLSTTRLRTVVSASGRKLPAGQDPHALRCEESLAGLHHCGKVAAVEVVCDHEARFNALQLWPVAMEDLGGFGPRGFRDVAEVGAEPRERRGAHELARISRMGLQVVYNTASFDRMNTGFSHA